MADRIIYASLAGLLLLGLMSFFVNPAYEKGVWVVLGATSAALSGALGFKFGVTIPKAENNVRDPQDKTTAE
jgi:hypothetical protein